MRINPSRHSWKSRGIEGYSPVGEVSRTAAIRFDLEELLELYSSLFKKKRLESAFSFTVRTLATISEAIDEIDLYDSFMNLRGQIDNNLGISHYREVKNNPRDFWRRRGKYGYSPEGNISRTSAIRHDLEFIVKEITELLEQDQVELAFVYSISTMTHIADAIGEDELFDQFVNWRLKAEKLLGIKYADSD